MNSIISVENESFKLKMNAKDKTSHNFRPHARSAELSVCRNSFAAFQLHFQCDRRVCINLSDEPWFSEFSDTTVLTIRHDGELKPILNHIGMHLGDDGFLYGDCLKSDQAADVEADVPAGVFVRFEIPKDIVPGEYTGVFKIVSAKLFDDEVLIDKIKYTLQVKNTVLPEPGDYSVSLDIWQHNCNIARKAGVPIWSDRHFDIIEQYLKTLAAIGAETMTVVVAEIPWSGQRCFQNKDTPANLFEYSMIRVFRNPDKTYTYDYSVLDRYIELCIQCGINKNIAVFGLLGNWISVNDGFCNFTETPEAMRIRYRMPDGSYKYMKKTADIENYIKALYHHFLEKGWLDKVRVMADEPGNRENLHKSIAAIKRLAPGFQYKVAFGCKAFFDEFKDEIEDFCIIITGLTIAAEEWEQIFKEDKKHKFTYYVCCLPEHPNTFLSSSLLETRYLAVLADYFGLAGFLYWGYTAWPNDPGKDIRYSSFPAGDTNFVYPGGDMQPLLTLRYMALRRAIEDYELLAMLRKTQHNEIVEEVRRMILTNRQFDQFYDNEKNHFSFEEMSSAKYKDYEKMRAKMYGALDGGIE